MWMTDKPSRIAHIRENNQDVLEIQFQSHGVTRYLIGAFICVWLIGWAFGFKSALGTVFTGQANAFILVWLVGWSFGGLFAMYYAYRVFHPGLPERFYLGDSGFEHDSGVPPFRISFGFANQKDMWRSLFPKRTRTTFTRPMLATLRIRESAGENRLTIDCGSDRLDLGRAATEIEREWLHKALCEKYGL